VVSENQITEAVSRQEQKKLKQENKRLQKELNRKDRALSETAALLEQGTKQYLYFGLIRESLLEYLIYLNKLEKIWM
jgi:hypothetical protein